MDSLKLELQRADVIGRIERDPLLLGSEWVTCLGPHWRDLLKHGRAKRAGAHAVIFQQGDEGDSLCLLLSGTVLLFARRDADTVELGIAHASDVIGEGARGERRWCSAVASGPVEFVEVDRSLLGPGDPKLEAFLERLHADRRRVLDDMADFVNRW